MWKQIIKCRMGVFYCAIFLAISPFMGCIEIGTGEALTLTNFHFCSEINDLGDYTAHQKIYTFGEQVFMYFELQGFKKRDDETAQIYQTLTVLTPNGTPFLYEGIPIQDYVMIDQAMDATGMDVIWFDNHLPLVNETWPTGTYNIEIMVEDRVANKEVTYTTDFIIELPTP